mgnify:CR=1 FL=1
MGRVPLATLAMFLVTAGTAACGAGDDSSASGDDFSGAEIKAYWADYKKLDVGDLTRVVASYANPALNDKLAFGGIAARIDGPTAYAVHADENLVLPGNTKVRGLDVIVDGLATRFGEKELGTEANRARLNHLKAGGDDYFIEAGFQLRAGLDHGWSFNTQGLLQGAGASLGFDAGAQLETRVILASPSGRIVPYLEAPLKAAREMRGFIFPESLEHVRQMKAGEMFALRGVGHLGANLGVGVPVFVAEPTAGLAYRVVVSGGVSGLIGGQLDVQLVRLEDDQVVVDVGVSNVSSVAVSAAVSDGWGVKGICDDGLACLRTVALGPVKIDLQRLVEKSVQKQLNKYLTFRATAGAGIQNNRIGLSRIRFHLDRGNHDEVERALQQALKFDTRLAFALYNRELSEAAPPVEVEFDALRSSTTTTRNFGFEMLGMNIYQRAVVEKEGSFVVQTPDGAQAILFDSLNKHTGLFQTDHGYTRTGVSALTVGRDKLEAQANLFVQTNIGDSHMDNDVILDNADAVLAALAPEALTAIDAAGAAMARLVNDNCGVATDSQGDLPALDCDVTILDRQEMKDLKARAIAAAEAHLGHLPDDFKAIARAAVATRLSLQQVIFRSGLEGPGVSYSVDYRLDDKALAALMSRSAEDYRTAVKNYLGAVGADRRELDKRTRQNAVNAASNYFNSEIEGMVKAFEKQSAVYRDIAEVEKALPKVLAGKDYIQFPVGIRFAVDKDERKTYENATMLSVAQDRALAAMKLFDDLKSAGDRIDTDLYSENLAAYPLLALVPPKNLELAVDLEVDLKNGFFQNPARFAKVGFATSKLTARGSDVAMISAGMFDLNAIIRGQ